MSKVSSTALPSSRSSARTALWGLLDVGGPKAEQAAGRSAAGQGKSAKARVHRLDNALAYQIAKRGISSKAIDPLGEFLGLGKGAVAAYLDLDRSTTHRRAAKDQLLPLHAAEGVLRLVELDQMAVDTFEDEDSASQWLQRPHPMLEGETPLQAAKSAYGTQRVKDILLAIQYGGVV
jgi:putative toxin-antitoxin system antitoxin component (TIGR02293 family)